MTGAGVVAFALTGVLLARPYLRVVDDHPEAERTTAQVAELSGPLVSFIAAPEQNLVWGKATKPVRDDLASVPEQTLFPGPHDRRARVRGRLLVGATGARCGSASGSRPPPS